MRNGDNLIDCLKAFSVYDYQFLTGTWEGPWGAAMSIVYEFCKNQGLGGYDDPTDRGRQVIRRYEMAHRL